MLQKNNAKQLAISMIAYTSASIVGPLVVFGGAGYYLSMRMGGGKAYLFIGLGIAFIVTNILQFFKIRAFLRRMNEESQKETLAKKDTA